jgi:carbon monoxide dehydrogenase subunit G
VAPCFPGATLDSVNGDSFTGSIKIKLGVIPLTYKGTARFVEQDFENHRATIEANGGATRTGSTATMLVTASATAVSASRTAVVLVTTLSITGRTADFTRQVMIDVGNEHIGKFADCFSNKLTGRSAGGAKLIGVVNPDDVAAEVVADEAAAETRATRPHRRSATKPANAPVNVLSAAKAPLLQQIAPVLGGIVLAIIILLKKKKPKPVT